MAFLPRRDAAHSYQLIKRRIDMAGKSPAAGAKVSEEMGKMEYEPILPVEKKLIGWSLGLGAGLIVFLYWLSATLFPAGH